MALHKPLIKIIAVMSISCAVWAQPGGNRWQLTAEQWSRPRSGEVVRQMDGVREAVNAWMKSPGATIVITYPGGEPGLLWAQELASWLVALGVPGANVTTRPGSPRVDLVLLELQDESP